MTETIPDVWDRIIEEQYQPIYRYVLHMTGKPDVAYDLTQETFYKAYQETCVSSDSRSCRSWLYTIARNLVVDRSRWWKRWGFGSAELPEQADNRTPEISILVKEVLQIMQKLPMRQREVFTLRNLHGFSTEETASLLGLKVGTVKSHLHRAIETIGTRCRGNDYE